MTEPTLEAAQRRIGPYRLLRLLGEGGAAHTWLAEDTTSGDQLAVKELRLVKSSRTKQIELFERECAILKELRHPQIPRFIDTVVERRSETLSLFLIQEFIAGESLDDVIANGPPLPADEVVAIMQSCLKPLEYLHDRSPPLYHRDIKPSNIIRRPNGECVLVDFGAVREAIRDARTGGSSVVGTFGYMAPEQFQARAYPETDLYGLAGTALHLLSGIEPGRFPLKRLKPDIHAHLDCDPHLIAILDILLEPSPEDRYSSARSLVNALERWDNATATADSGDATTALLPRVANQLKRPRSGQNRHTDTFSMGGAATVTQATTAPVSVTPTHQTDSLEPAPAAEPRATDGAQALVTDANANATGVHDVPASTESATGAQRAANSVDAPAVPVSGSHAGVPSGAHTIAFSPPTEGDENNGDESDAFEHDEQAEQTGQDNEPPAADEPTDPATGDAGDSGDGAATEADVESATGAHDATDASDASAQAPQKLTVETEDAPFTEAFTPGGQGASKVGLALAIVGLGLVAVGLFAPLQYNEQVWVIVGSVLGVLGIALLAVPRAKAGKLPREKTETTSVMLSHIVKRSGPLGSIEWIVEYQYLANDGLHYDGRFRLPNAAAAREVANDPSRVRAKYDPADPEASSLILVKA